MNEPKTFPAYRSFNEPEFEAADWTDSFVIRKDAEGQFVVSTAFAEDAEMYNWKPAKFATWAEVWAYMND